MQELAWLSEIARVWLEGGAWAEISALPGFQAMALLAGALVPSSLILVGIAGLSDWRETPLAAWYGLSDDPDANWADGARDLDKDGLPDF